MNIVIVGGVAGGASAAARLRRLDEQASIVMFERSANVSYANCGLPYYIGGTITDRRELTLQTPQSFKERFNIDVRVRHEVQAINTDRKTVTVRNLASGQVFEQPYDKLILSPGARPTVPPLPGNNLERMFTLRTVEDALRIRDFAVNEQPKTAVIAGGGFIGIEIAENLRDLGIEVTMVQRPKQLLKPLDAEMAAFVHNEMRRHGVRLNLGLSVEGFRENGQQVDVLIKDHAPLTADMVILAIGVTPDTALAKSAGIALGEKGAIIVNDYLETSVPDIYAVGDAVQIKNTVSGEYGLMSLAGPANRQGRIAADNICGRKTAYRGGQGSSIIKVFDLTAASTGINKTTADRLGLDADMVYLTPLSHAGYYPGGTPMTLKVVYEKGSFRLLGAQIVGKDGVDKRIDVLATAIHAGLRGTELADLHLAYAPPYSSAKDPVNLAGYMMQNIEDGLLKQFHIGELPALLADEHVTVLDTRTVWEYQHGHMDGTVNIPVDELRERLGELDKAKPVYVLCQTGLRSYVAVRMLEGAGFTAYNCSGGYRLYEAVHADQTAADGEMYPCGMPK